MFLVGYRENIANSPKVPTGAPFHWIELDQFSDDCVLVVLASAPYDDADYMRDYPDFVAAAKKRRAG